MFRRSQQFIAYLLTVALTCTVLALPANAKTKAEKEAQRLEKIKTELGKLGTGPEARIAVKLRNKTRLTGYVSQFSDESVSITDLNTKATTTITYPDIASVQGKHLSKGAWITIGVLAGVGIAVTAVVLKRCGNEGGC